MTNRPNIGRGKDGPHELAAGGPEELEQVFLQQLAYIEHVVGYLVRRHALNRWDADDFASWVHLRLITDDYAILRKFKGRSKLTTFLTTVITNLYRDFRIQRWGKWRSSAAAKHQGELGVQLESLLYRDGYSLAEAIKILHENFDVSAADAELERIASVLRPRFSRRFETEEALVDACSPIRADDALRRREHADAWLAVLAQVRDCLDELSSEDRTVLRMRFEDGMTVAAIARELDLDQRRLYLRVNRLRRKVRRRLEPQGDFATGELQASMG